MKNEVICRDNRIDGYVTIQKTSFREAVLVAVSQEKSDPEANAGHGR
jgi:hypothetical protein